MHKIPQTMPVQGYTSPHYLVVSLFAQTSLLRTKAQRHNMRDTMVVLWCSPDTWFKLLKSAIGGLKVKLVLTKGYLGAMVAVMRKTDEWDIQPQGFPTVETQAYPFLCMRFLPKEIVDLPEDIWRCTVDDVLGPPSPQPRQTTFVTPWFVGEPEKKFEDSPAAAIKQPTEAEEFVADLWALKNRLENLVERT